MPLVNISMLPGRTLQDKQTIVDGVIDAFDKIGVAPDAIWVKFTDVSADDWFVGNDSLTARKKARDAVTD
jgi:phenylpyruvate tautomerase PptA (4-oxalocrotonate tautomerase family)